MAINKNFVVKNGFEVATNLVYADSDLYNVGIGSTIPRTLLDVRGGIAVTDFSASGISTFLGEVNIGVNGASNTFVDGKSGFGTDNPHYLVHINSPVSTGQTALYVRGDMIVTGDINLDDLTLDTLVSNDVTTGTLTGTIATITTLDGDLADFVNISANTGIVTTIRGTNLSYSGIGTIATLDGTTADFTNLYANVGIVTTLIGTNFSYSGIGTVDTLNGTSGNFSSDINAPSLYSTNLYSDVGVVTTLTSNRSTITHINGTNLNVVGISTLGTVPVINSYYSYVSIAATISNVKIETGSISAVSGILTYYGDGSKLSNVIGGVGIATTGGIVGYGATILDFRGAGISTITVGSGIGTVEIGGGFGNTEIERDVFNITSPTSTFATTSNFEPNYFDVYLNGVKLNSSDYSILSPNSFQLVSSAVIGDIVEVANYKRISISLTELVGSPSINVTNSNVSGILTAIDANLSGNVNISGIVTASSFDSGGTSSQFVKGDGSLDSNSYTTTGKSIAMAMVFGG
jgi:hypothetical protein